MASRLTNLTLFAALGLCFVTGVIAFGIGTPWGHGVLIAHGVAGLALILLTRWKSIIVRRGLARRREGTSASIVLGILIVLALASGIAHSSGLLVSVGPISAMQIHVATSIASIPLLVVHVFARPVRPGRRDLTRRNLLRSAGLISAGAVAYAAGESLFSFASLPGARRRFTGSLQQGSFDPDAMPVTQWLNDSVQEIDRSSFVLKVGDRAITLDELEEWHDRLRATIDCTGGWYSEQDWAGVLLQRLLDAAGARSISVVSHTGYARLFPAGEANRLLLATRVGGVPLNDGHGGPVRLVAPGRRGFWWVKWVERVDTSDRPWWSQSPFPLT
jgi:Oxidoreductase molybdopterin binding domain